jgi:hypothetical protein
MLSILFCYSAPPNGPCINISHTKPIMSRCLSSSVILPPSNSSCPITPQLPCHPVPMSTAVRRALQFRPPLCHLRRGSHSLRSLPQRGNVRLHSGTNQANQQGSKRVPLYYFYGGSLVLYTYYFHFIPPLLYFFRNFAPFFSPVVPASLRLFGSNGLNDSPFRLDPSLPTKKVQTHLKFEPSTARTRPLSISHSFRIAHSLRILPLPPFIWVYFYYLQYLLATLWCIRANPLCPIR